MNAFAYRLAAAVLFALVLSAPVAARDCRPQLREGWVRMPPSGMSMKSMPTMAGFGRIVNPCSTPATILSARSPSFASVELHETRIVDGVSKMRPVPSLRVAPDGAAILRPGGMHLMLMRPGSTLKAGSRIVVEFELSGGGTLLGEFEVRKPEL
jgi:periplasmic copper chaperone A